MATAVPAAPSPERHSVGSVRDLIDRFHGRSPTVKPEHKQRPPPLSEGTSSLSPGDRYYPLSPLSPKSPGEGQYVFRAAKARESPLDFIHKLQNQQEEDEEKEKYVTLLKHVKTDEEEDVDRGGTARQTHLEALQKLDATDVQDGLPAATGGTTVATPDASLSKQEPKGFDKNFGNHYTSHVAKDIDLCLDKELVETEGSSDEESPRGQLYDVHKRQLEKQCSLNSVGSVDIDFSVIEGTPHLNLEVSKQKLQLRRGSLTNRRRPSRSSMRSMSETELFEDLSDLQEINTNLDVHGDENVFKSPPVNGHLVWPAASKTRPKLDYGAVPSGIQNVQKTKAPPVAPKPTGLQDQASKPSWLASAKLRKSKSTDHSEPEPESGKPDWMQEALAKKRRAAELLSAHNTAESRDISEGSMAPWMKEKLQKRKSVPADMGSTLQRKNSANAENIAPKTADTSHKGDKSQLPWRHKSEPGVPSNNKVETAKPATRHHSEPQTGKKVLSTQPVSNYDTDTTPPSHGHVIYVSPTCKEKDSTSPGGKENTHSMTGPLSPRSDSGTDPLSWKAEIATRKKTKSYIPSVRPETPLRLGETPQWKKELAEKNKQRKEHCFTKQTSEVNTAPTLPLWKQELAQRRRRSSGTPPVNLDGQEPEWKIQAEKRRERLAEAGLLGECTTD